MSGLAILDVVIGLVFVYLLLSLFCTVANEIIANLMQLRSKNLAKGLESIFDGNKELLKAFRAHPKIKALIEPQKDRLPSYLSSDTFVAAYTDLVESLRNREKSVGKEFREAIDAIKDEDAKQWLLKQASHIEQTVEETKKELGVWFDEVMERATGWYRREIRRIGFGVACVIVIVFNADSINIAKRLWSDDVMRNAVVKLAEKTASACTADQIKNLDPKCPAVGMARAFSSGGSGVGLPLGWANDNLPGLIVEWSVSKISKKMDQTNKTKKSKSTNKEGRGSTYFAVILWLLGLYFSVLAVSLGAPFWFDVLKKAINIRNSGFLPKETGKKKPAGATT